MDKCIICGMKMKLVAESSRYLYYKCAKCDYYCTCSKKNDSNFDYNDYITFDGDMSNYENNVEEAIKVLKEKFQMIGFKGGSFLDIGCSEGVFVDAYQRMFDEKNSCGIEVSINKIKNGRERGLNIFSWDDIDRREFHFVLLRHVIEHEKDPYKMLCSIRERIDKNGFLCVETPNNSSLGCRVRGDELKNDRFYKELYPPTHIVGFTPKSLRRLLKKCGYKVVKATTYGSNDEGFAYGVETRKVGIKGFIRNRLMLGENLCFFAKVDTHCKSAK